MPPNPTLTAEAPALTRFHETYLYIPKRRYAEFRAGRRKSWVAVKEHKPSYRSNDYNLQP